jgi:Flp pilus assembly protein TadD
MRTRCLIAILLIAGVVAVYWQVSGFPFMTGYDDEQYILENRHVRSGLTPAGVRWAFTAFHASNWHPLTWLSHMADVSLFGMKAGRHHLVNVLFHAANAVFLFFVLSRMTGSPWKSGFVAALFALHPLHVESVAAVAQRKDVLSAFFMILAIGAHVRYAERPSPGRALSVPFLFGLGLLAKPMIVTLPFVLLLLDYWPLRRFHPPDLRRGGPWRSALNGMAPLVAEKVPCFFLAAFSCTVTYAAQDASGVVRTLDSVPAWSRIGNALIAYVGYLWKAFYPLSLSVFYPHPGRSLSIRLACGAGLVLLLLSFAAVRLGKRRPFLPVGWFWYLGTLVPMIGLVQVGAQSMADRYTYVPLIGIFMTVAWGVPELLPEGRARRCAPVAASCLVLVALSAAARVQAGYWRDPATLFSHALETTSGNWVAHNNLGVAMLERGNTEEAVRHIGETLRLKPNLSSAHYNLGMALRRMGKTEEAVVQFREAVRLKPSDPVARNGLGVVLGQQGRFEEAVVQFREAIRWRPEYESAHYNLGIALLRKGDPDEAVFHFREVLKAVPDDPKALRQLSIADKEKKRRE